VDLDACIERRHSEKGVNILYLPSTRDGCFVIWEREGFLLFDNEANVTCSPVLVHARTRYEVIN